MPLSPAAWWHSGLTPGIGSSRASLLSPKCSAAFTSSKWRADGQVYIQGIFASRESRGARHQRRHGRDHTPGSFRAWLPRSFVATSEEGLAGALSADANVLPRQHV